MAIACRAPFFGMALGSVFLRYRAALPASPLIAADLDLPMPETNGFATLVPLLADTLGALTRNARTPIC